VLWGMILLFDPPLAIDMLQKFMPILHGWFTATVADDTFRMIFMLAGFAIVYLVYIGLVRLAPRIVCRVVAVLLPPSGPDCDPLALRLTVGRSADPTTRAYASACMIRAVAAARSRFCDCADAISRLSSSLLNSRHQFGSGHSVASWGIGPSQDPGTSVVANRSVGASCPHAPSDRRSTGSKARNGWRIITRSTVPRQDQAAPL